MSGPGESAVILIIEDDQGAVETFGHILSNNGYGVRVAFDAESALAEVDRVVPAAVLVDLHLPTIDGVEFLRRLRARAAHARVPIAMVTGDYFIDEALAEELKTLHARVHFKPLWEDDLLQLVRDLLGSC